MTTAAPRRAAPRPFPVERLPTSHDEVTLEPDDPTSEHAAPLTTADVEAIVDAALHPIREALSSVLSHVGPDAQRHRARREAALLASAVVGIGCLGLGALDLQGASDVTIGILGGLVLAAVVAVVAVLGRVSVTAKAPGVSIGAGAASQESQP